MFRIITTPVLSFLLLCAGQESLAQSDFWEPTGGPRLAYTRVISIKSSDTIFAGGQDGLARSTDRGETWEATAISDEVYDILVAPRGEIFAAKLEHGLFRSSDNGISWTLLTNGLPTGEGQCVSDLALHPNGDIFAAGFLSGGASSWSWLYRSSDAGDHWTEVLSSERWIGAIIITDSGHILTSGEGITRSTNNGTTWTEQGPPGVFIHCFATSPSGYIFGGTYDRGVLRSTDGGISWDSANTGLTGSGSLFIFDLAVMNKDTLFAILQYGGLFRSTDNGQSWMMMTIPEGNWWGGVAANPDGLVLAGGRNLYRSNDGGETWSQLVLCWNNVYVASLAVDAGDMIYAGGDGLFRSSDHGVNWTELKISEFQEPVSQVRVNSRGDVFARITPWHSQSVFRSTDHGEHWTTIWEGEGYGCSPAFNDSGHILIASNARLCRSTNDGQSWDSLSWSGDFPRISALAIHPTGDYFAGTLGGGVFRSTDHGASWDSVNNGVVDRYIRALDVSPAGDLYARISIGHDTIHVFRSTDRGASWTLWPSLPEHVRAMLWTKNGDLYMASDLGVYRNNIQTNSGLTDFGVWSLAVDSRGYLYAGTEGRSVFRSVQPVTGVEQNFATIVPQHFALEQNYPNPFNPTTVVCSQLPVASNVKLVVHNLLGQEVAVLVDERRAAGYYRDAFDASSLASGVYFYRLSAGEFTQTRRMMFIK